MLPRFVGEWQAGHWSQDEFGVSGNGNFRISECAIKIRTCKLAIDEQAKESQLKWMLWKGKWKKRINEGKF
jgi:hypothetical protein